MFSSASPILVDNRVRENAGFVQLKNAGIIVSQNDLYKFSSPYAKRYLFNHLFPNRSESTPSNVNDLVIAALKKMSYVQLNNSIIPDSNDFPKEAVFQHMLLSCLASETPPYVCICSELGKRFPKSTEEKTIEIEGEIDFYIDGNIRWGIEILTKGDRLKDHMARCDPHEGRYAALEMIDYVVIDFRREKPQSIFNIKRDPKRMTVLFPSDTFQFCKILVGLDQDPLEIELSS
jgi:hypothetical protein